MIENMADEYEFFQGLKDFFTFAPKASVNGPLVCADGGRLWPGQTYLYARNLQWYDGPFTAICPPRSIMKSLPSFWKNSYRLAYKVFPMSFFYVTGETIMHVSPSACSGATRVRTAKPLKYDLLSAA